MRQLLARRIGPAPIWVYLALFIVGMVVFLRWRASRQDKILTKDSDSLVDMPYTLAPYTSDIFVNVQQPTTTPAPNQRPHRLPGDTPPAPPRRRSVTYRVVTGDTLAKLAANNHVSVPALYAANKATLEAVARQHGYDSSAGGSRIWSGERLVIPT